MEAETQVLIDELSSSNKTSLKLEYVSLKLEDIEYLVKKCPQLTKLSITGGNKEWLEPLKFLPNLEELTLSHCFIYGDAILKVLEFSKLQKLRIESEKLYPNFFSGLSTLENLKDLAIVDCDYVRDESLELISQLTHLTSLELVRPSIKKEGYHCLSNLMSLTSLSLDFCTLNDSEMLFLHSLKKLESLRIIGSDITNKSLKSLKSLENLIFLELSCEWDLINDRGLKLIVSLPKIEELTLHVCAAISDKGLKTLSQMPRLRRLTLKGNRKITLEGIKAFKSLAPNIQLFMEKDDIY